MFSISCNQFCSSRGINFFISTTTEALFSKFTTKSGYLIIFCEEDSDFTMNSNAAWGSTNVSMLNISKRLETLDFEKRSLYELLLSIHNLIF